MTFDWLSDVWLRSYHKETKPNFGTNDSGTAIRFALYEGCQHDPTTFGVFTVITLREVDS